MHHRYQKFGRVRNVKLKPLQNTILVVSEEPAPSMYTILDYSEPIEDDEPFIETDYRYHYKKVLYQDQISCLYLFRYLFIKTTKLILF